MFGNRRTALLVSAAIVGGAMLTTACQESDSNSKAGQGTSPAAPAANTQAAPPAVPGSATTGGNQGGGTAAQPPAGKSSGGQGTTAAGGGGGGAGDNGSIGKCRSDDLRATAQDATITGDAERTVAVTFKNIGHNCTMSGFAGVDLETNQGPLSAKRTGRPADPFTLKSDTSVSFGVTYPSNDTGGSGVRITGLLVTPPGETKSITVRWPGAATLPVTDGAGSPVKVGPIGSAGQGG
ncbi:DUF4232 domain-containing protein [Embleya sp. NPDC008237]|uniref:DUF4232 domain-containing protein n=1 Tax=Embleya sp. NPDC008237 TaxID=3363978 RepID=UPI0036E99DC7